MYLLRFFFLSISPVVSLIHYAFIHNYSLFMMKGAAHWEQDEETWEVCWLERCIEHRNDHRDCILCCHWILWLFVLWGRCGCQHYAEPGYHQSVSENALTFAWDGVHWHNFSPCFFQIVHVRADHLCAVYFHHFRNSVLRSRASYLAVFHQSPP